jgi:prevent-host-death family protein
MSQVNIHYAKTHLSKLVERAACGEEIIIARAGKPVARLAPISPAEHGRRFGAMKGQATVDERFFEPLPNDELAAWE